MQFEIFSAILPLFHVLLFLYFQPYLLLAFVVLISMQVMRAKEEEQVLSAKFGEEYQRYKASTWFNRAIKSLLAGRDVNGG